MASEVKASAVMPSATPTETEIVEWGRLPRDEQLLRLREALATDDCLTPAEATMGDILTEARRRADQRRG